MDDYSDPIYYEYRDDPRGYPQNGHKEDFSVCDFTSISYTNGSYDESPSPSSGVGFSSTAMTPSASQSSHGSHGQSYPHSSPQRKYVGSYGDSSMDCDQMLDFHPKYCTSQATGQTGDDYDYELASSSSLPLAHGISKHRNSSSGSPQSPGDYTESFAVQDHSPVSQSFPSRSRKSSNARKSDVSYVCLAYGCTSTARFRRVADLQRHYQSVHSDEHFDCPIRKCSRKGKHGLGRKDHLRDHLKDVHMQSPEHVKLWMDEVQTITNLRNIKKNMTPDQKVEAQEMERKMPSARSVLVDYY